jgi:hypothetical protein
MAVKSLQTIISASSPIPSLFSHTPTEADHCGLKAAAPSLPLPRGSVFRSHVRAMIFIHGIF